MDINWQKIFHEYVKIIKVTEGTTFLYSHCWELKALIDSSKLNDVQTQMVLDEIDLIHAEIEAK